MNIQLAHLSAGEQALPEELIESLQASDTSGIALGDLPTTEYRFPENLNVTQRDCGPLATFFLAVNMGLVEEYPPIENMQEALGKLACNGTPPGDIFKYFGENSSVSASYYTGLDYESFQKVSPEVLTGVCSILNDPIVPEHRDQQLDPEPLKKSIDYVLEHQESVRVQESGEALPADAIREAIGEGGFAIILINGDHYIVVTEMDTEGDVVIFDPNYASLQKMSRQDLSNAWAVSYQSKSLNIPSIVLREVIIVKKKKL